MNEPEARGLVVPNLDTEANRDFWDFVTKTAAEVRTWPKWMLGDYSSEEEEDENT